MDFVTYKYDPHKLIRDASTYDKKARDAFRSHTKDQNVLYFFFGKGDCIYIGESGTSLYDRCYTHENPHTDKSWFADTDEVRIIVLDSNIDLIARQSLEATFILAYRPKENIKG